MFIPNFEGYYQKIFEVVRLSIQSAWVTQHTRSAITVINNGSCKEVSELLEQMHADGIIETLISHKENIGKVDAILGAARGCREDLITFSDADILFLNGWQKATESIFEKFERAGSVAPFPISRHLYYFSTSTQKAVVRGKLKFKFENSSNSELIKSNYQCYGWDFDPKYDGLLPVIYSGGEKAVLGSGHQVFTLRREVIFQLPNQPSFIKISNSSESLWIDEPIDLSNFWRLSTYDTWVVHMGNKITSQYEQIFRELKKEDSLTSSVNLNPLVPQKVNFIFNRIYSKLFKYFFDKRGPAPKLKRNINQDGI